MVEKLSPLPSFWHPGSKCVPKHNLAIKDKQIFHAKYLHVKMLFMNHRMHQPSLQGQITNAILWLQVKGTLLHIFKHFYMKMYFKHVIIIQEMFFMLLKTQTHSNIQILQVLNLQDSFQRGLSRFLGASLFFVHLHFSGLLPF